MRTCYHGLKNFQKGFENNSNQEPPITAVLNFFNVLAIERLRLLPMEEGVKDAFLRILKNRKKTKKEPTVDGYGGFLFLDKNGNPMVALHWEKYMQHAREKYNKELDKNRFVTPKHAQITHESLIS